MSLTDQQWCPTSVQVTVLQARGLRVKGKSGTNDAYAVMQVGKEKFQTSVVEKTVAPMWKEEATFDLPPPLLQGGGGGPERSTLHVHVLHRALVGPDKLLGQAVVNLLQLSEDDTRNKTEWFKLLDKAGKPNKDRGEVLLDIQFMRNNMTASMFDLSAAGKSRSRLSKFKDKVRGKKKELDPASVPALTQVLTDSEEEETNEDAEGKGKPKKHKMKSLFAPKTNLQKTMSQSMSVLPAKNSSLSGSQSSGLNVDSSEGKKKFKFSLHKRSGSSDSKDSFSGRQKQTPEEPSNLCINGSHVYCEEPQPRSARIGSNFSLNSSGHGSMEDVPESSPPSVESLKAVREYSPWIEEEEDEDEEENTDELKEEEKIKMEEERKRKEEETLRRQREELDRLAKEKLRREEEKREQEMLRRKDENERLAKEKLRQEEEERAKREEEERIQEQERREEEERIQEQERREEEERIQEQERREEEERIQKEKERRQAEEKRREKEERAKKEEEQRRREEEERIQEEQRRREEEERIQEEKKRRQEEEERIQEEKKRRQEEEERRKEEEEQKRLAEEKRQREEEEKTREEMEKAQERKRQEEESKLAEEKRLKEEEVRAEEERRQMEKELQRKREQMKQREEEERLKKEEMRRLEEEKARKEREECERLMEERRVKEEEERVRMEREKIQREQEEMKRKEEEEILRKQELERLAKDKLRREEEERRREEEERIQKRRAEEERIEKEKQERIRKEEERARKEKEEKERVKEIRLEEEKRRLEERVRREERAEKEEESGNLVKSAREEGKERENKTKREQRAAEMTSLNPFDENFSEEIPNSSPEPQQSSQSALSSTRSSVVSDDKDQVQREKGPAPQPPGRKQSERRRQKEETASTHLSQTNKQSKEKDVKTVSVPPQRSVQAIAPLSRSSKDLKNTQTETLNNHTNATTSKPSKRPAPSRPLSVDDDTSTGPKTNESTSPGGASETRQVRTVPSLNPFEDDEDEVCWPPVGSPTADQDATSQAKIKSLKVTHAPPPPPLMNQNSDEGPATGGPGIMVPNDARDPQPEVESPNTESSQNKVVKKEGPPTNPRRLLTVKPLNPLDQQPVTAVQEETDNKPTALDCSGVQHKKKVDPVMTGPYSQLTREELVALVLKQENQLADRDKKISELELYIDNLLVRVIEEQPSILMSMSSLK